MTMTLGCEQSAFVFVSASWWSQLDLCSQLPNHRKSLIFQSRRRSAPLSRSSPFFAAPICWIENERFNSQLKFLPVYSQQVIRPAAKMVILKYMRQSSQVTGTSRHTNTSQSVQGCDFEHYRYQYQTYDSDNHPMWYFNTLFTLVLL